jgi:DNA-directed RNA polymerase subunit alpha
VLSAADQKYHDGRLRELRRDPEGAIALYDEALGLDGSHRSALFRLALNVDLRGEDEEARELYERALLCPPVNSACVMNLGVLYEDLGNYRRAMQCYDLVVQADPANERARLYRRDAASSLTMYCDEAQEALESRQAQLLRTPIGEFELSARSAACLARMNVRTIGDLAAKTERELLSLPDLGETSLAEIERILRHKGLRLHLSAGEGEAAPAEDRVGQRAAAKLPDEDSPDPARRSVRELDLSVRSRRVVDLFGILTIGELADKTEAELLTCPNFGQSSLNEVKQKLNELGLGLRR